MKICFIGKPGAGKGMASEVLSQENFIPLPTGELLKKEIDKGTDLGLELKRLFADGKLAPLDVVVKVVKDFLEHAPQNTNIIFDGFPRSLEQAKTIEKDGISFDCVVHFDIDDETIRDRILNRLIHKPSGRVYNTKTKPPKVDGLDDLTGDKLIKRDDDNEDTFVKRMSTYYEITDPLISYYKNKNIPFLTIDAKQSPEKVIEEILSFTTEVANDLSCSSVNKQKSNVKINKM